jgi:hypothetical protein
MLNDMSVRPESPQDNGRIGVVVDPSFGDRIDAVARRIHVWVAATTENRRAAATFRRQSVKGVAEAWDKGGCTLFDVDADESPEASCIRILDTVLDHHPDVRVLEIHGVVRSKRLDRVLMEAGFGSVFPGPEGCLEAFLHAV